MPPRATAKEFGAILRSERSGRGLSQAAVAEALRDQGVKVTGSAVGEWERGDSEPTRDKVFALERIFGMGPGRLSQHLGYYPTDDEREIQISASGVDLEELRRLDPEAYDLILRQAELALDRARDRREA